MNAKLQLSAAENRQVLYIFAKVADGVAEGRAPQIHNKDPLKIDAGRLKENDAAAQRAAGPISAYMFSDIANGKADEEMLVSMFADLRHWCDRNNVSFDKVVALSASIYNGET